MSKDADLFAWLAERSAADLPDWQQLPDLELYMDQVVGYLERSLNQNEKSITPSMINNYVKSGLIERPVKKKYQREHLAALLQVCLLKQILSIRDIDSLFAIAGERQNPAQSYEHFCKMQQQAQRQVAEKIQNQLAVAADTEQEMLSLAYSLALEANLNRLAAEEIISLLAQSKKDKESKKEIRPEVTPL